MTGIYEVTHPGGTTLYENVYPDITGGTLGLFTPTPSPMEPDRLVAAYAHDRWEKIQRFEGDE